MVAKAKNCDKHEQVVTWNPKGQAGGDAAPGDVIVGTLALGPAAPVSIHAFSFGASNETIVSGGGSSGAGKVKVADVEVLRTSTASPSTAPRVCSRASTPPR